MTDERAAEIAAKLTPAQKRAVLAASADKWLNSREIGAAGPTLFSLCWYWPKGADPISSCECLLSRDYQDRPLRYIYRLNNDGLAVRRHLEGSTDE